MNRHVLGFVSVFLFGACGSAPTYNPNVRSLSPVVNQVNLVDKITHLLSFVPGVNMQDEVTIDFNLEFEPSCLE